MTRNSVIVAAIAVGFFLMTAGSASAQSHVQFSNMNDFETGVNLAGAGILERTKNTASLNLALQGLDTDAAYTIWWVVFNNPENCAAMPCGLGDLGDPAVEASVFWATGFVTGADGTANVSAHLDARNAADGASVLFGPRLNQGNGFDAEIHVIVRTHGAAIAGATDGQISTVDGSCGVNTCDDQQAIIFLPIP